MDKTLESELCALLNYYSAENESNTPDYILANYLLGCLNAYNAAVKAREAWHGRETVEPAAAPRRPDTPR